MWLIIPNDRTLTGCTIIIKDHKYNHSLATNYTHIKVSVQQSEQNGILCDSVLLWLWGIWVNSSFKTHLLRPTRKVKYCKKELELIFGTLQRAPASRSECLCRLLTQTALTNHKAKTQSCASSSSWSDLPWEHTPKSSRSRSQARDETWPKWVITENKTREGFWIVKLLGQQKSTVLFTSPEEKLKCDRMAAGLGRGECSSEKTKEQEPLVLNFRL